MSNMFLIQEGGRLLYIGQNEWTHINCALWSSEVFEDDEGSLKNVHMAVLRGKQRVRRCCPSPSKSFFFQVLFARPMLLLFFQHCEKCQLPGATVSCCLTSCTSNYHFMCARHCHCVFLEDKKVYCPKHSDLIKGEVSKSLLMHPHCGKLECIFIIFHLLISQSHLNVIVW